MKRRDHWREMFDEARSESILLMRRLKQKHPRMPYRLIYAALSGASGLAVRDLEERRVRSIAAIKGGLAK